MISNSEKKYSVADLIDFLLKNNRQKAAIKLMKAKRVCKGESYPTLSDVIQYDFVWATVKDGHHYWTEVRDFVIKLQETPQEAVAVDSFRDMIEKGEHVYKLGADFHIGTSGAIDLETPVAAPKKRDWTEHFTTYFGEDDKGYRKMREDVINQEVARGMQHLEELRQESRIRHEPIIKEYIEEYLKEKGIINEVDEGII